jgi:pimeloyl-ACP methyl ester carboxylesterase
MPPLPQLGGIPATLELLHELGIGAIRRTKMTWCSVSHAIPSRVLDSSSPWSVSASPGCRNAMSGSMNPSRTATDWALVQSKVAAFTRVCSYDRSGAAWSDLGPKPRSMDQEAFDLHRLLTSAGERGPYVVVGQSLGGMVVRIFAEEHPKEVVGVVLVDAYSEDAQLFTNGAMKRMRLEAKNRPIPAPRTRATAADGLTPDESQKIEAFVKQYIRNPKIDPPYDKLPECAQRVRLWAMQQPKNYAQDDDYMAEISARMYAEDQAQEHPLGSVPLVVLTRDKNKHDYQGPQTASLVKEHEEQQARMAKLSSDGKQVVVPNSGHQIELEAPEKVVAAIHDIAVYRKN